MFCQANSANKILYYLEKTPQHPLTLIEHWRLVPTVKPSDLFSDHENLKGKLRKLINMQNFFPACDFCDGRPNDPTTALEYAGKGLIKAAEQTKERLPYTKYK
mgnify:CR=1 FL=1